MLFVRWANLDSYSYIHHWIRWINALLRLNYILHTLHQRNIYSIFYNQTSYGFFISNFFEMLSNFFVTISSNLHSYSLRWYIGAGTWLLYVSDFFLFLFLPILHLHYFNSNCCILSYDLIVFVTYPFAMVLGTKSRLVNADFNYLFSKVRCSNFIRISLLLL